MCVVFLVAFIHTGSSVSSNICQPNSGLNCHNLVGYFVGGWVSTLIGLLVALITVLVCAIVLPPTLIYVLLRICKLRQHAVKASLYLFLLLLVMPLLSWLSYSDLNKVDVVIVVDLIWLHLAVFIARRMALLDTTKQANRKH